MSSDGLWSGRDDDLFTIDDGVLAFREPPNYEDPQSASTSALLSSRNVYRVTVEAAGGTRSVTVTVDGRGRDGHGEHRQAAATGIGRPLLGPPAGRG